MLRGLFRFRKGLLFLYPAYPVHLMPLVYFDWAGVFFMLYFIGNGFSGSSDVAQMKIRVQVSP